MIENIPVDLSQGSPVSNDLPTGGLPSGVEVDTLIEFFSNLPAIAFIKDESGRYVYANAEFGRLVSVPVGVIAGTVDDEIFPLHVAKQNARNDLQVLSSGKALRSLEVLPGPDGVSRDYNCLKFSFQNKSGKKYIGGLVTDITDSRRAQRAVAESQARLKAALEAGFDAFFILEPLRDGAGQIFDFKVVEANRNGEKLLDLSRWDLIGMNMLEILPFNPDYGFFDKYVRVVEDRTPIEEEFHLTSGDGRVRWFRHQVVPLGEGVAITTRDITEQVETTTLASQHTSVLENALGGIAFVTGEGKINYANAELCRMLGRPSEIVIGMNWLKTFAPDDSIKAESALFTMSIENRVEFEAYGDRADGRSLYIRCVLIPMIRDGKSSGHYMFAMDVTERRVYEQRLEEQNEQLTKARMELQVANARLMHLASTDGLTGLRNRRDFEKRLDEEVREAKRYEKPLSVVMMDVDNFKLYNDSYGHPAGDDVLRDVSAILTREARTVDLVSRYGGEEFSLLLPDTDIVGAAALCERIRLAIQRNRWSNGKVTASLGCAQLNPAKDSPLAILERADQALYAAKDAGRNCVRIG